MEFTLNVNLNLSEATERTLNRLADAFGKSLTATQNTLAYKVMSADEVAALEAKIYAEEAKPEISQEVTKIVEEVQKTATRTRKPAALKVEEPDVEETKPEVVEK